MEDTINCPKCGNDAVRKHWYEDHCLVEQLVKCDCGYCYHWTYGYGVDISDLDEYVNKEI